MISLQDYHLLEGKYKQLQKENTNLKADLQRAKEDYQCSNDYVSLCEELAELKQQLEAVKTLNRDEVEKIIYKNLCHTKINTDVHYITEEELNNKITAICNLALPSKDRE